MLKLTHAATAAVLVAGLSAGCASTIPVSADSLTFDADVHWRREVPQHESRRLQFTVPSTHPDLNDARLIVWNFATMRDSGDGLTVQANIERWLDQFTQDDGTPTGPNAKQTEYFINGMPVHIVDITGRYRAETAPGNGARLDQPGYRMLGAYVNAPQGDYIVKLWGPAAVVGDNLKAFKKFVWSVKPGRRAWPQEGDPHPMQPQSALTAIKNAP